MSILMEEYKESLFKRPWFDLLSLTMILMSLVATITGYYAGFFSSDAVLNQQYATRVETEVSSILMKIYLIEAKKNLLKQQFLDSNDSVFLRTLSLNVEIAERDLEVLYDELDAKEVELVQLKNQSDLSFRNYKPIGFSLILTQLALLFGSISGLLSWKSNWYFAILLFVFGLTYMLIQLLT